VRLAVLDRPLLAIWRGTEAEGTRTRTPKPFGIFVIACVRFVAVGRVKKKASAPRSRLACNHLQSSFRLLI
jgi:hypothetical protein